MSHQVEFIRVTDAYKNVDRGAPRKSTIDGGVLHLGKRVHTDAGYTIIIKVGDVYLEVDCSEWGHVKNISKEEADKVLTEAMEST